MCDYMVQLVRPCRHGIMDGSGTTRIPQDSHQVTMVTSAYVDKQGSQHDIFRTHQFLGVVLNYQELIILFKF